MFKIFYRTLEGSNVLVSVFALPPVGSTFIIKEKEFEVVDISFEYYKWAEAYIATIILKDRE